MHGSDDGDGKLEAFGRVRRHYLNLVALVFIGELGLGIEGFFEAAQFIEEIDQRTVRGACAAPPDRSTGRADTT